MLTNAPHLSGGGRAQICFLCSLMHHVFVSACRVPPCFVLSNAPRLLDWPKSVSCALQCTTSVCLSIGSNLVCAHQCTASIWRGGPNLFPCSLMHLVYVSVWRVPLCFLCSLMHLVCWTGSNLFTCSPMYLVCVSSFFYAYQCELVCVSCCLILIFISVSTCVFLFYAYQCVSLLFYVYKRVLWLETRETDPGNDDDREPMTWLVVM